MSEPVHKMPSRGALAGARTDAKSSKDSTYDPRGVGAAWSHNFLNQKPWHPANFKNQARVYEAQQEKFAKEKRNAIAKSEFEAEQEYMKTLSYLSPEEQRRHAERQAISFMYTKPPGMDVVEKKQAEKESGEAAGGPGTRQSGGAAGGGLRGSDPRSQQGGRGGGQPPMHSGHLKNMLGAVAALQQQDRFELKPGTHGLMGRRSPPRGGRTAEDHDQQFVVSGDDDEPPPDPVLLEKQAKALLKQERRLAKAQKQERKRKELEEAEAFLRSAGVDLEKELEKERSSKKHKKAKKAKR